MAVLTVSPAPTPAHAGPPRRFDGEWQLTGVQHVELAAGHRLSVGIEPTWLLVGRGSVNLVDPWHTDVLQTGDAALLEPGVRREIAAERTSRLVLADLGLSRLSARAPLPQTLLLPGFADLHPGVVALVESCPLTRDDQPASWMRSYAGLIGSAVVIAWQAQQDLATGLRGVDSPVAGDEAVARVVAALIRAPGDDWTLDRMAGLAHLSRSSLVQRFRHQLRASPAQVLRQVRMRQARLWLADGSRSVTEIAFAIGYNSTAAFSRAFTDDHGISPRSWRRQPGRR